MAIATKPLAIAHELTVGTVFSAVFESGCVVTEESRDGGFTFLGLDSEGVECSFSVAQVTAIGA